MKELKGHMIRLIPLVHQILWNPVKELKDDIIQLIVARRVQVESGEGIESHYPVANHCRRVSEVECGIR